MSAVEPIGLQPSSFASPRRRVRGVQTQLGFAGSLALGVLTCLVLLAVLGPLVEPREPNATDLGNVFSGPTAEHLLGTDGQGRDLLSRLIAGARTGLLGPLLVVLVATATGTIPALIVAWRGGVADATVSRGFDLVFAFPGILLAILAAAVFGKGLTAAAIAIAISYSPYVFRLVRSGIYRELPQPYVAALRSQGFSDAAILIEHILANLGRLMLAQSTIIFAYATADLAAISFLGLGVQPPTADWGAMVAGGLPDLLNGNVAESLLASMMIAITIVCANVLANRLEGGDAVVDWNATVSN